VKSIIETAFHLLAGLLLVLTLVAVFITIGWALYRLIRRSTPRQLVEEWCRTQHLTLIDMERRYLRAGPFFLSPNGTAVFYSSNGARFGKLLRRNVVFRS
jgi:hypothetical protein